MRPPRPVIHIVTTDEVLQKVDDWRNRQPIIPSRVAAARYLLEQGLDVAQKEPKKGRS